MNALSFPYFFGFAASRSYAMLSFFFNKSQVYFYFHAFNSYRPIYFIIFLLFAKLNFSINFSNKLSSNTVHIFNFGMLSRREMGKHSLKAEVNSSNNSFGPFIS